MTIIQWWYCVDDIEGPVDEAHCYWSQWPIDIDDGDPVFPVLLMLLSRAGKQSMIIN